MKTVFKAILADLLYYLTKLIGYLYWNYNGVRITFSCQIAMKAKIAKGCVFTGNSIVTEYAEIGEYTYGHNVNINNATLGSYCSLGPDVKIGLDEHPLDKESTHPHFYQKIIQNRSLIKDHVWIGTNSVILCGVKIFDHSVIAAGAVVKHDVEARTIVGGVPAKFIKKI